MRCFDATSVLLRDERNGLVLKSNGGKEQDDSDDDGNKNGNNNKRITPSILTGSFESRMSLPRWSV